MRRRIRLDIAEPVSSAGACIRNALLNGSGQIAGIRKTIEQRHCEPENRRAEERMISWANLFQGRDGRSLSH
jgi:hypothetical protein